MQQVFSMCSMLLQRNTDTRKRKLNIRRYKVSHIQREKEIRSSCIFPLILESSTSRVFIFKVNP